jgi:anthranilate phosphoribosyltransferase
VIFDGETGAARDLALLNAGAAIYTAGGAETLTDGVLRAAEAVDGGAAKRTLDRFVSATHEHAPA